MGSVDAGTDQVANDMAVVMGCVIFCLLIAPIAVQMVFPFCFWAARRVRGAVNGRRHGTTGTSRGIVRRLDMAMERFQIPLSCREELRDKLLELWVMTAVATLLVAGPILTVFGLTIRDLNGLQTEDGAGPDSYRAFASVFTVVMLVLGVVGGMARIFSPRLRLPAVRAACQALITAHEVRDGRTPSTRLDASVSGLGAILVHWAQKDESRWLRAEMTTHATRVRDTLRAGSREVLQNGPQAVDAVAPRLGKILHGLCMETPLALLGEAELVPATDTGERDRKKTALLVGVGIALSSFLALGLTTLGVPEGVVSVVSVGPVLLLPLFLWGPSGLVHARDLLSSGSGESSPAAEAEPADTQRTPQSASSEGADTQPVTGGRAG
ncbi:hypothetical protein [Streptomyces sp. NBC_00038]|uniref:hypothetical protein n=1 Tax=Streptomyces sp. NBC_00038 TaxID=2903615 RepID=UPI0022521EE9|nr:hypothetical protein [Streptomyces sp. NBC_00038]MCX5555417.1 hypothetical protein [Streptomyces sp. NBC_00038]